MKVKILAVKRDRGLFTLLLREEKRTCLTTWCLEGDAPDEVGAIKVFVEEWESGRWEKYKKSDVRTTENWGGFTPEQLAITEGLELDLGGE